MAPVVVFDTNILFSAVGWSGIPIISAADFLALVPEP